MSTFVKVSLGACLAWVISLVFYAIARSIWNADIERLSLSPFWGSSLDIGPYLNWAHYTSAVLFFLGIGIFLAGVLMREKRAQLPLIPPSE
jgi:hypothetical protein